MCKRNAEEFVNIKWQNGVVPENGVNGAQIVDALLVVAKRVDELNSKYPDKYNEETKEHIHEAICAQHARNNDRVKRGVEGKDMK